MKTKNKMFGMKLFGMMLFGMSALFTGCQENEMANLTANTQKETKDLTLCQYGTFPQSKEFKLQSRSSNFTFETDWEELSKVTLANGQEINLPWSNDASANFEKTLACDVKKEDGWQMVYHSLAGSSNADDKHYIIFYNQRTGFLKTFVYATTMPSNNTGFWLVDFEASQRLFNATPEVALPANIGNIVRWRCSNPSTGNSASFKVGWNVFQVQLAYEPNTTQNQFLEINTETYNITYEQLYGILQSYSTGTILTSTNPDNTIKDSQSNISGYPAAQYITDNLLDSRSAFGDIIVSAIKKGVNKLVSSFIGSTSEPSVTRYDVELKTRGTATFTGTMTTMGSTDIMSLSIPANKAAFGTDLGAWNLASTPTVYVHPIGTYLPTGNDYSLDECYYKYEASGNYDCDVIFNPELEKHLIKYWTTGELIRYTDADTNVPQVLVSNFDYGSLAGTGAATMNLNPDNNYYSGMTGTGTFTFVENDDLIHGTFGQDGSMYDDHLRGVTNFRGLLAKYGTPQEGNTYPYIYLPDNINLARGGFSYDGTKRFLKLTVYTVTEFEGKRDTTINTRTFAPKIEWDPELCNEFKDIPINTLSNYINR